MGRKPAAACVNLMVVAAEGRVGSVSFDTFPVGSMGEAKCQNFAV